AEYHGKASRHTIAGCPELSLVEEGSKVTYTNAASEIPPAHIETLCPEGLTYIFGCGHVGAATARVLTAAGFAVVACDDRPGTLTPEWVPGVYDRRLVDYKNLGEQCPIGPRDLVVVATAGHKSDIDVGGSQAMRAKPACLGCHRFAPHRRRLMCVPATEQEGFTQDQIDGKLHLPIGVAIEAEDPRR
ncbi:MAG: XdhC family protein, partial [Collinsella sp.]